MKRLANAIFLTAAALSSIPAAQAQPRREVASARADRVGGPHRRAVDDAQGRAAGRARDAAADRVAARQQAAQGKAGG